MIDTAREEIEVRDALGHVTHVPLAGARLIIGRGADAAVRLESATISRRHAELFSDPFGRWWVRDLGSRNGTLVNGELVNERMLNPGDTLQIEDFFLTLRPPLSSSTVRSRTPTDSGIAFTESSAAPIRRLQDLEPPRISAAHLRALTEFGSRLLATPQDATRLEQLCQLMVSPDFHGNTAVALRLDNQDAALEPQVICPPQSAKNWRSGEPPYVSRTLLSSVRQNQAPVVASNVGATGVVELSLAGNVMSLAAIACPLHRSAQAMDLLYVTFPPEFGTGEWLALAALASEQFQQASTVWAARRASESQAIIEEELRHAYDIQMRLVPRRIGVPGLEAAIGFEPCRWVAGDYVDVVALADGKLFVTVADVCGKGLQAALITATLHSTIHTGAPLCRDLGEMMRRLNGYLCATLPDESFVTMIGLTLDPASGALECINAGHPPAMVIARDGGVRQLQAACNLPLGFLADAELEMQVDRFERGQLLALYTDGLTEMEDESGQMLGLERLGEMLRDLYRPADGASASAEQLSQRFKAMLDHYQGGAVAKDDRTYMLIRLG